MSVGGLAQSAGLRPTDKTEFKHGWRMHAFLASAPPAYCLWYYRGQLYAATWRGKLKLVQIRFLRKGGISVS